MRKKIKIPTFLGIIILVIGIFAGVYFLGMRQVFRIGADATLAPRDIRSSNQGSTSVTINWVTDKQISGFILWGNSRNAVSQIAEESQNQEKYFTHQVTITGLEPNTTYFYKINSGGDTFDNSGVPWEFTTGPELGTNQTPNLVSGTVITPTGTPAKRALVYANLNGYLLSTISSEEGTYVFQLGNARSIDLQRYIEINPASTLIEISVQHESGIASAQIFPQSAKPVPPMILGQVYNFRDLEPSVETTSPDANLNLPEDAPKTSKFNLPIVSGTPTPTSVILESLKEGEVISSQKPAFFGRGPANQAVTISIANGSITENFSISSNGTWTWTPPNTLSSGANKVTVSWVDGTGITRIIERSFIIQAGEVPSFEATPSQTLAPTATPTLAPTPTATPRPSATPVLSTPTGSPSATPSAPPIPETGGLAPTLILSIMGIVIMSFSYLLWKFADN